MLAGILLGLAYQRTGNLYFSIGIHAGWIFVLKLYTTFTVPVSTTPSSFWGTGKLIDGWVAFLVLVALLVGFKLWPLGSSRPAPSLP